MITREKLNNLRRLPLEDIFQIFHECVGALAIADMDEAEHALGISKRRIYQLMNDKNSVSLGKHEFPCINLFVK
ncbi:MAG: hypothetical protein WC389_21080 [Lutibacter sp.]|jgi:hypothetical protein